MKRAAVLQNQFELLRFRLSPRFLLCLVRSEPGTLLTLLRPQERLFAEHGNKVLSGWWKEDDVESREADFVYQSFLSLFFNTIFVAFFFIYGRIPAV